MGVEELEANEVTKGKRVPWTELMALEKIDECTFKSKAGAMSGFYIKINGVSRPTTFGGHVSAQAVWAAAQTVREGLVVHSATGYFTSRGLADRPLIYHVRTIKSGRNYCQRAVEVTQDESSDVIFSNICSFKLSRPDDRYSLQEQLDIQETYRSVTNGQHPGDLPERREFKTATEFFGGTQPLRTPNFAGLHTVVLPMQRYNENRHPIDKRALYAYAGQGTLPSLSTHANLHAALHIYASDREALYVILRHLDVWKNSSASASLSQTVIFHGGADLLSLLPSEDAARKEKWFFHEAWTDRAGDGRATQYSRISDDAGRHVATCLQDGMLQLKFKSDEEVKQKVQSYPPRTSAGAAKPSTKL